MKLYALVHNDKIVVGPRSWSVSFFAEYLNKKDLDYTGLSKEAPSQVIDAGEWKILPVERPSIPPFDSELQDLAGPFWDILNTKIVGRYSVVNKPYEAVKAYFKSKLSKKRYDLENVRISVDVNGENLFFETSREFRKSLSEQLTLLKDGDIIYYKHSSGKFLKMSKADLFNLANTINNYIQSLFLWEMKKSDEIDKAISPSDFKMIDMRTEEEKEFQERMKTKFE